MDRRTFVLGTSTAFLSQVAPSDQFNLGVIGSGGRGQLLMRTFAEVAPVRFEGVCDVYEPNLESGLSLAKGSAKAYRNYKALLDNQSIQAIKGDVLMCPSGILLPFILDPLQWIGCETLIAGWLKVHPPVTHPRALRTERERANRTGRSGTTLSY